MRHRMILAFGCAAAALVLSIFGCKRPSEAPKDGMVVLVPFKKGLKEVVAAGTLKGIEPKVARTEEFEEHVYIEPEKGIAHAFLVEGDKIYSRSITFSADLTPEVKELFRRRKTSARDARREFVIVLAHSWAKDVLADELGFEDKDFEKLSSQGGFKGLMDCVSAVLLEGKDAAWRMEDCAFSCQKLGDERIKIVAMTDATVRALAARAAAAKGG